MHIQVLLSTYNGAAFLLPQLESVLQQEGVDISILIRDDGSSDATVSLIEAQIRTHPNIRLIQGPNIGAVRSFFALLEAADDTADLFAFCDQDDVWLPGRLRTAATQLASCAGAALFASPTWITFDGRTIGGQTEVPRRPLALANALVQNRLIGCTMVFNWDALALVRSHPADIAQICMHDWWLYLAVSAFGMIRFHPIPTVLYRQHALNVVGVKSDRLSARLERFRLNRRSCSRQAIVFREAFGPILSKEHRALIGALVDDKSLLSRVVFAFSGRVYRQHWVDDLLLKLLLILNRV